MMTSPIRISSRHTRHVGAVRGWAEASAMSSDVMPTIRPFIFMPIRTPPYSHRLHPSPPPLLGCHIEITFCCLQDPGQSCRTRLCSARHAEPAAVPPSCEYGLPRSAARGRGVVGARGGPRVGYLSLVSAEDDQTGSSRSSSGLRALGASDGKEHGRFSMKRYENRVRRGGLTKSAFEDDIRRRMTPPCRDPHRGGDALYPTGAHLALTAGEPPRATAPGRGVTKASRDRHDSDA